MLLTFQLYGSLEVLKTLPGVVHCPFVTIMCSCVCEDTHGLWEMNANHTACRGILLFSVQGSIQQLVLKSDPTAPDDQCEEDDPYVSARRDKHAQIRATKLELCLPLVV